MTKRETARVLRALADRYGCTMELTNAGHWKLTTPSGAPVYCASTPSCYRALKNTEALLRKATRAPKELQTGTD